MSNLTMPTEEYAALETHHDALHHPNRMKVKQQGGKRTRAQRRLAGVPRCPDCGNVVSRCDCWAKYPVIPQ